MKKLKNIAKYELDPKVKKAILDMHQYWIGASHEDKLKMRMEIDRIFDMSYFKRFAKEMGIVGDPLPVRLLPNDSHVLEIIDLLTDDEIILVSQQW